MHPVMRRNFGMWAYHEHPRPGVLLHVQRLRGERELDAQTLGETEDALINEHQQRAFIASLRQQLEPEPGDHGQ